MTPTPQPPDTAPPAAAGAAATPANERVAVLVVHGIADQRPGQTVREVARLLCQGGDGAPAFVQGELRDVLVPVAPLEAGPAGSLPAGASRTPPAGGTPAPDTARQRPGTPSGFFQAQQAPPAPAESVGPEPPGAPAQAAAQPAARPRDLGLALIDYLLGRLALPEGDALYESTRISLRRRADGRAVDVFEMYWADLSRLGAGGLRALVSLYQLFFHLGTLAADIVDQAALRAGGSGAWGLLQRLHARLAWLMKGPVFLLQLAMLLMVAFGGAALVAPELQGPLLAVAFGLAAVALTATAGLAWLRRRPETWRQALPPLLLAAAALSLAAAVTALTAAAWVPRIYFVAGLAAAALLGALLVERYARLSPGVRGLGHLVTAAAVLLLAAAGARLLPRAATQAEWMIGAALHAGEVLLAAVLLAWAVFIALQIAALLLGGWLGRAGDRALRESLHTARLALVCSSGLFAVLSLVLWSVVSFVAGRALPAELLYEPLLFGSGYRSAAIFLESRVQTLGGFFTPLVLAFSLMLAAVVLVLLPSLMEELRPTRNADAQGVRPGADEWSRRLGRWLGDGTRFLGTAFKALVPLGAMAAGTLYLAFVLRQFAFTAGLGGEVVAWLADRLELFRGETLVAAGKWLAGGALTIAALGARFTGTFGRLRVAIDAVLDVDNYFDDPPHRRPPRARIYARYASLLAYLRDAGYGRIVIVAHSQGTVISVDLLRYLHVLGRLKGLVGARPIALVTVGSPLRDLYAERFPLLYEWMGAREAGFESAAPAAGDIGVTEWVNACRSGDYVGRFIWTPDRDPAAFGVAAVGPDGRVQARRAGDRTELCLGAGAHTHYFSRDAAALAAEIERLIAGGQPRSGAAAGAEPKGQ